MTHLDVLEARANRDQPNGNNHRMGACLVKIMVIGEFNNGNVNSNKDKHVHDGITRNVKIDAPAFDGT